MSNKNKVIKNKTVSTKPARQDRNLVKLLGYTVGIVVLGSILFFAFSSMLSTETYYTLNVDVPSKAQITTTMVNEQITSKGTGPQNALTMAEIQRGVYARVNLSRGEVVSFSVAGVPMDTDLGIPDDWSITSFTIESESAVGGIVTRGDFMDLMVVSDEEGAKYVYNNLLVLDASFSSRISEEDEANARVGETIHYTVGLPGEDVGFLHSALNDYTNIKVIKAPNNTLYGSRDTRGLDKYYKFGPGFINKDLYEGVDPTFTPIIRDEGGRPVNAANCEAGLIEPSTLCTDNGLGFDSNNSNSNKETDTDKIEVTE